MHGELAHLEPAVDRSVVDALAHRIIAGCDVILFSDDPNADLMYLVKAVADGRLTQERVDEAVTRVLALKAALSDYLKHDRIKVLDALSVTEPKTKKVLEATARS